MTGKPGRPLIDTTVPHSARIWNYWLGGKDHYPVDRAAGDRYRETFPQIVEIARQSRYFLARVVRFLAGEAGIRQFLDVGTGLPVVDNTHEVAQRVAPECRIVYVDNDPLVLVHARVLLTSAPEGACDYVDADLREPEKILRFAERTLDLSQPVGLMLLGVLPHIGDYAQARAVVGRLMSGLAAGSYLAISHAVDTDEAFSTAQRSYDDTGAVPYRLRSPAQVAGFFDGLELVEPGVVPVSGWRPDPDPFGAPPEIPSLGGVAVKRLSDCWRQTACDQRLAVRNVGGCPGPTYGFGGSGKGISSMKAAPCLPTPAIPVLTAASSYPR